MKNLPLLFFLILGPFLAQAQPNFPYSTGEAEFSEEEQQSNNYLKLDEKNTEKLRDSIDWAKQFPTAGQQGSQGSCWAWVTTYAIRSHLEHKDNPTQFLNSSRKPNYEQIFSPAYTYQFYKGDKEDCNTARYSNEILARILQDGAVSYKDFPYDEKNCNRPIPKALKKEAAENALSGYEVVMIQDVFTMKKILADGNPLILATRIDYDLYEIGEDWDSSISEIPLWSKFGSRAGTHAMVVVGYNDKHRAFKVLNSWGSDWGDKGYVWISYDLLGPSMNYSCYPRKIAADLAENQPERAAKPQKGMGQTTQQEDELSTWFKKNHFRTFEDLKVVLKEFKPGKEFGIVEVRAMNDEDIKRSFYIEKGESKVFYLDGEEYEFTFENIDNPGRNPLKRAMIFSITK